MALSQGGAGEALGFSLFWRRSQPRRPWPFPSSLLSRARTEGGERAQGPPGEGLLLRKTGAKARLKQQGGSGSQWVPCSVPCLPRWPGAREGLSQLPAFHPFSLPPDPAVSERSEPAAQPWLGPRGHTAGPFPWCWGSSWCLAGGSCTVRGPHSLCPSKPLPWAPPVSARFGPRGSQLTRGPCIFRWLVCLLCKPDPGQVRPPGSLGLRPPGRLWPPSSGPCPLSLGARPLLGDDAVSSRSASNCSCFLQTHTFQKTHVGVPGCGPVTRPQGCSRTCLAPSLPPPCIPRTLLARTGMWAGRRPGRGTLRVARWGVAGRGGQLPPALSSLAARLCSE